PRLTRGVAALVDEETRREQARDPDRNVDVEDPAPVEMLRDEAADERPDRERHRRDARPDADRLAALPRRERGGDDRERRRVHERAAKALDDARADQEAAVRRQPAGEAGPGEDDQSDPEDQAAA